MAESKKTLASMSVKIGADVDGLVAGFNKADQKRAQFTAKTEKGLQSASNATLKLNSNITALGNNLAGMVAVGSFSTLALGIYQTAQETDQLNTKIKALGKFSESEISKMTLQTKQLAVAWGKDVNEVLNTANTVSKEFGITLTSSLSLIDTGMRKGADIRGQYLEQLGEYSYFFKQAGLSAKEATAFIARFEAEGTFSDKAPDALKESVMAIREMTDATRKALNGIGIDVVAMKERLASGSSTYYDELMLVSKEMQKLPPSSEKVGAVLADVFKGAGEDAGRFVNILSSVELNLDKITDNTSDFKTATNLLKNSWVALNTEATQENGFLSKLLIAGSMALTKIIDDVRNLNAGFKDTSGLDAHSKKFYELKAAYNSLARAGVLAPISGEFSVEKANTGEQLKFFEQITKEQQAKLDRVNELIIGFGGKTPANLGGIAGTTKTDASKTDATDTKAPAKALSIYEKLNAETQKWQTYIEKATTAQQIMFGNQELDKVELAKEYYSELGTTVASTEGIGKLPIIKSNFDATSIAIEGFGTKLDQVKVNNVDPFVEDLYELEDVTIDIGQNLGNALGSLISDTAVAIGNSLTNVENKMTGMQRIGLAFADFMQALGGSMIAAGIASEVFQKTLLANPLASIAAGGALLVAATVTRNLIEKNISVPEFANGGIVSGPTLGLVGEYPGAKTDPEVISPLSKLQEMLNIGQQNKLLSQIAANTSGRNNRKPGEDYTETDSFGNRKTVLY